MELTVRSWNDAVGPAYSDASVEDRFISYRVDHQFNQPAECWVTLADIHGAIAQKYGVTSGAIYVGPGKVAVEDPTDTDYFVGRILKATANTQSKTVELYCQDWLSQLNDEQIDYDMREDLNGSDLRESELKSDPNGTEASSRAPVYTDGANYYVFDNDMDWTLDADNWNGNSGSYYFVCTAGMAGTQTVTIGPKGYSTTFSDCGGGASAGDSAWNAPTGYDGDNEDLWDDDTQGLFLVDNDDDCADIDFVFRFYINKGTNTYVSGPTAAKITLQYYFDGTANCSCILQLKDQNAETWSRIDEIPITSGETFRHRLEFDVPEDLLAEMLEDDGTAELRFAVTMDPTNTTNLKIYYLMFEASGFETQGLSGAYLIEETLDSADNIGNQLELDTDMYSATQTLWEGCPYCIAQKIYTHIESATGPILGPVSPPARTPMVTLTCGAANVEDTTGISTRQYIKKTRLEIAQDLAPQDKAVFWIALGGTTVTWKSTFAGAAAATITDTDVNSFTMTIDGTTVCNKAYVQGMRIGDSVLESTYSDAASIEDYNATRTRVTQDSGLVSEYDTLARATALVGQYKDPQLMLTATIAGNTGLASHDKTMKLGDEIQVTSTYLFNGATNWYIVHRFQYDSSTDITTLTLHPRLSATGLQSDNIPSYERGMAKYRQGSADRYIPSPADDTITNG